MDLVTRLKILQDMAADNPPDLLTLLDLITRLANDVLELKERIKKLENEVG